MAWSVHVRVELVNFPMATRNRWSKMTLVLVMVGLAVTVTYYVGLLRLNFPSPKRFPIQGIDVSHHQGHVSWFTAGLHGVQFAYIKATEGADYRDPRFLYNWEQSRYSGIARGAYHFFSFCRPGIDQAQNFLDVVPADPQSLPPALDLEFSGNCGRVLSRTDMQREVSGFVHAISRRFAGPPVFYVTQEFYKRYLAGHRQDYPPHKLWIRNVVREPTQTPCLEWSFWQYGSLGRIPGIVGPVDLNVYCGSAEQFADLTSH